MCEDHGDREQYLLLVHMFLIAIVLMQTIAVVDAVKTCKHYAQKGFSIRSRIFQPQIIDKKSLEKNRKFND